MEYAEEVICDVGIKYIFQHSHTRGGQIYAVSGSVYKCEGGDVANVDNWKVWDVTVFPKRTCDSVNNYLMKDEYKQMYKKLKTV